MSKNNNFEERLNALMEIYNEIKEVGIESIPNLQNMQRDLKKIVKRWSDKINNITDKEERILQEQELDEAKLLMENINNRIAALQYEQEKINAEEENNRTDVDDEIDVLQEAKKYIAEVNELMANNNEKYMELLDLYINKYEIAFNNNTPKQFLQIELNNINRVFSQWENLVTGGEIPPRFEAFKTRINEIRNQFESYEQTVETPNEEKTMTEENTNNETENTENVAETSTNVWKKYITLKTAALAAGVLIGCYGIYRIAKSF